MDARTPLPPESRRPALLGNLMYRKYFLYFPQCNQSSTIALLINKLDFSSYSFF